MIRLASAIGAGATLLLSACGTGAPAGSGDLSSTRLFAQTSPAVVLVYAAFTAPVVIPDPYIGPAEQQALVDALKAMVAAGQLDPNDEQAVAIASYEELAAHIFNYVTPDPDPTRVTRADTTSGAIGSGFIVSPDGVVVTNAHVAAPGDDAIKQDMAQSQLSALTSELRRDENAAIPAATVDRVNAALVKWAAKYIQVGKVTTEIATFTGTSIPGVLDASKGTTAEVLSAGEPIPGKDVAILKLEGQKSWPTAPVGDDSQLEAGATLYVVGYPAPATFNPAIKQDQPFTSSLTNGVVSGRKQMTGGWSAIQTNAASEHGSSGGPVLDSHGAVVGVLTFGSVDPNTGQPVQGFNFAVPSTIVKEFLAKAGVKASESRTTSLYVKGLEAYDQGHYRNAVKYFDQADTLYPGSTEIQDQRRKAQQMVDSGKDSTPFFYCWFNACPS